MNSTAVKTRTLRVFFFLFVCFQIPIRDRYKNEQQENYIQTLPGCHKHIEDITWKIKNKMGKRILIHLYMQNLVHFFITLQIKNKQTLRK